VKIVDDMDELVIEVDDFLPRRYCEVHSWHPRLDCLGSLWLVRVHHPLAGLAWSCLPHAIRMIRLEPRISIVEAQIPDIATEIYRQARG
jgi:hypothetical protein